MAGDSRAGDVVTDKSAPLRAFHGDPALKARYLARVEAHARADRLVQGDGWENGKGCAIGCTLEAYDHSRYPDELGIPIELAYLKEAIFEGLPPRQAMLWPRLFLSAIHPGADLSLVWPRFAVWLLTAACPSDVGAQIAGLYRRRIRGDEPTRAEWSSAARAARGAARAAANAAAAAAGRSARSRSALDAATATRWAARSAPAWAARSAAWQRPADMLLRLLSDAEVRP